LTAVLTAASDHDHRSLLAALYGVLGLAFVPAIVFSMIESRRRQAVLRAETGLCLVLALASFIPPLDPGISLLLVPATLLLATSAGIVFAANRPKKER
jgi:Na+/proline symporter